MWKSVIIIHALIFLIISFADAQENKIIYVEDIPHTDYPNTGLPTGHKLQLRQYLKSKKLLNNKPFAVEYLCRAKKGLRGTEHSCSITNMSIFLEEE